MFQDKLNILTSNINNIKTEFEKGLCNISSLHFLMHDFKSSFLGKESFLIQVMKDFQVISGEEKKIIFPLINDCKQYFEIKIKETQLLLEEKALQQKLESEKIDFTIPVLKNKYNYTESLNYFKECSGSLHPVSFAMKRVSEILKIYGFTISDGFEIEDDFHNFTGLNVKRYHPARQMQDTFYLNNKIIKDSPEDEFDANLFNKNLLRTHTTSVTLRSCKDQNPPIRNCSMGKVYRVDSDKTHSPMFHQCEVVAIDRGLSIVDLKFYIERLLIEFFEIEEKELSLRFRPSYFPFTSPSFEVDIRYDVVDNKIILGKGDKYLEILGSGILHQNVLQAMNIDHEKYSSIAFGCGIERILMLKYGMSDIRSFYQGDINWLKNYNFNKFDFVL